MLQLNPNLCLTPNVTTNKQPQTDQRASLATLARTVSCIGGTSGALYSIMLTSASNYIQRSALFARSDLTNCEWVNCFLGLTRHCIERLSTYSGAKRNDRSMLGKMTTNLLINDEHAFSVQINQIEAVVISHRLWPIVWHKIGTNSSAMLITNYKQCNTGK